MKIDKSRFTAKELTQYEKLIAKASVPDEPSKPVQPEKNKPEKSPEPSGKDMQKNTEDTLPDLLAPMQERMEQLKKSSETNHTAYLAMLDKALALAQKSGLFTEIGRASHDSETGGAVDKIQAIATELQKAEPKLNRVCKAWELPPELVQEYDNNYFHRS